MGARTLVLLAAAEGGGLTDINWTLNVATLVLFLIFAIVLGRFAWKPLLSMIEEREKGVRDAVEGAERANTEAAALLEKHKELIREAARERDEVLKRAAKEAEQVKADLDARARAERADRPEGARSDRAREEPGDPGAAQPGRGHRDRRGRPHRDLVAHARGPEEAGGRLPSRQPAEACSRPSRPRPMADSEIAQVFKGLPQRYVGGTSKPRTFYFSLDDDEKWTVALAPGKCAVDARKTDDADCFFKASEADVPGRLGRPAHAGRTS